MANSLKDYSLLEFSILIIIILVISRVVLTLVEETIANFIKLKYARLLIKILNYIKSKERDTLIEVIHLQKSKRQDGSTEYFIHATKHTSIMHKQQDCRIHEDIILEFTLDDRGIDEVEDKINILVTELGKPNWYYNIQYAKRMFNNRISQNKISKLNFKNKEMINHESHNDDYKDSCEVKSEKEMSLSDLIKQDSLLGKYCNSIPSVDDKVNTYVPTIEWDMRNKEITPIEHFLNENEKLKLDNTNNYSNIGEYENIKYWKRKLSKAEWKSDQYDYCNHNSEFCCFARLKIPYDHNLWQNHYFGPPTKYENVKYWAERNDVRKAIKVLKDSYIKDESPCRDWILDNDGNEICSENMCKTWKDYYLPYTPDSSDDESERRYREIVTSKVRSKL